MCGRGSGISGFESSQSVLRKKKDKKGKRGIYYVD